jgi:hypothetical protein
MGRTSCTMRSTTTVMTALSGLPPSTSSTPSKPSPSHSTSASAVGPQRTNLSPCAKARETQAKGRAS